MEFALPTALAALVLILLYWRACRHGRRTAAPGLEARPAARVTVVLDVGDAEPGSESVRRLVHEAASRARAGRPEITEIEVLGRTGKLLERVSSAPPEQHLVSFPSISLLEPRARHRTPEPPGGLEDELHPTVIPRFEPRERPAPKRPLADSFDLPEPVQSRIRDRDDPIDIVRAILDAAGLRVEVAGDVVQSGDTAIVVLPHTHEYPADALNHAFLRFRESGALSGFVVSLGLMDPGDVRRRELLAPEFRHAGREAIQRMGDAVAVGSNPLAFAFGPAVLPEAVKQGGNGGDVHGRGRQAG
ncbi:MAG: hypothetical protein WEB06_10860 [Actinomycetota bacterium]